MYKPFILTCFCIILVTACDTTNNQDDNVVINTDVNISFVDQQGADLLDPEHPNAIMEQNTNLYYLIDGKKKKYFEGNLDHSKGFFVSDEKLSNRYLMRVFPNIIRGEATATTYMQFSDGSMDTIKVGYEYFNGNSVAVDKVWYNGEVRFDVDSDDNNEENIEHLSRYFIVTKDVK